MAGQKLSVCMIVKNEERFLEDCLRSVKNVADQIVVIDTGSTDRTKEIAQKYDAEVHSFVWQDNFAAARNASLKYAKGDWILWLDADERLLPESAPKLKALLKPERKAVAYLATIKSMMADGKTFKLSTGHRLFNNRKNIYFEGRIHEQIIFSVARAGGEERPSEITLFHLGYGLGKEEQKKKDERNRHLLLKMVKEEPSNAYAHFTLGQNYNMAGENENALKHYLIALKKNRFPKELKTQLLNTISEVYLKLKQTNLARKFARQSIGLNANQISGYYLLYRISESEGKVAEALQWINLLREKNQAALSGAIRSVNDILLSDVDIAFTQAELLYRNSQIAQANRCLNEISGQSPQGKNSLRRIVEFWTSRNEFDLAYRILKQNEQILDAELLDMLGIIQIKKQNFPEAIQTYTRLFGMNPQNLQIVKRLAGLFLKIGEKQKANQLLKVLNELNALQPNATF